MNQKKPRWIKRFNGSKTQFIKKDKVQKEETMIEKNKKALARIKNAKTEIEAFEAFKKIEVNQFEQLKYIQHNNNFLYKSEKGRCTKEYESKQQQIFKEKIIRINNATNLLDVQQKAAEVNCQAKIKIAYDEYNIWMNTKL